MVEKQMKWRQTSKKILETAKYLRKGTIVIIDAQTSPELTTVEGRYGKRQMIVINTKDYGVIYVSPLQLVKIVEALEKANWENVSVEL